MGNMKTDTECQVEPKDEARVASAPTMEGHNSTIATGRGWGTDELLSYTYVSLVLRSVGILYCPYILPGRGQRAAVQQEQAATTMATPTMVPDKEDDELDGAAAPACAEELRQPGLRSGDAWLLTRNYCTKKTLKRPPPKHMIV